MSVGRGVADGGIGGVLSPYLPNFLNGGVGRRTFASGFFYLNKNSLVVILVSTKKKSGRNPRIFSVLGGA